MIYKNIMINDLYYMNYALLQSAYQSFSFSSFLLFAFVTISSYAKHLRHTILKKTYVNIILVLIKRDIHTHLAVTFLRKAEILNK